MASIYKEIETNAKPEDAWAAMRDVGALHTRLVPGFVVDTRLEPGARVVSFGNGMVVWEPIITVDETARRVVWSAEGGRTTHYSASTQRVGRVVGEAVTRLFNVTTADYAYRSNPSHRLSAFGAGVAQSAAAKHAIWSACAFTKEGRAVARAT